MRSSFTDGDELEHLDAAAGSEEEPPLLKQGSFLFGWLTSLSSSLNLGSSNTKPKSPSSSGRSRGRTSSRRRGEHSNHSSRRPSSKHPESSSRHRRRSGSHVSKRSVSGGERNTSRRRPSHNPTSRNQSPSGRSSKQSSRRPSAASHNAPGRRSSHNYNHSSSHERSSRRGSAHEKLPSRRATHLGTVKSVVVDDDDVDEWMEHDQHKPRALSAIPSGKTFVGDSHDDEQPTMRLSTAAEEFMQKLQASMDEQLDSVRSRKSWEDGTRENSRPPSRNSRKPRSRSNSFGSHHDKHLSNSGSRHSLSHKKTTSANGTTSLEGKIESTTRSSSRRRSSRDENSKALQKLASWPSQASGERVVSSSSSSNRSSLIKAHSTNRLSAKLNPDNEKLEPLDETNTNTARWERKPKSSKNEGRVTAISVVEPMEPMSRISFAKLPEAPDDSSHNETSDNVAKPTPVKKPTSSKGRKVKKKVTRRTKKKKGATSQSVGKSKTTSSTGRKPKRRVKKKVVKKAEPVVIASDVEDDDVVPPSVPQPNPEPPASATTEPTVDWGKASGSSNELLDPVEQKFNGSEKATNSAPTSWLNALKPTQRRTTSNTSQEGLKAGVRRSSRPVTTTPSTWGASFRRARQRQPDIAVFGDDDIMDLKEHGSCTRGVQENLRFDVQRRQADKLCCYTRSFAEASGYWHTHATLLNAIQESGENEFTFYDSVHGKRVFTVPRGRPIGEFLEESTSHGWPSFRDLEVDWENVRLLKSGETVTVDGVHLGHNLPDGAGRRYCVNLSCIAGRPTGTPGADVDRTAPIEPPIVACRDEDFQRAHGELE